MNPKARKLMRLSLCPKSPISSKLLVGTWPFLPEAEASAGGAGCFPGSACSSVTSRSRIGAGAFSLAGMLLRSSEKYPFFKVGDVVPHDPLVAALWPLVGPPLEP